MYTDQSLVELLVGRLSEKWEQYKIVIISSLIAAGLAYIFVFTNKIPNWDDMQFLFGKGYTLTSGRWGLDLLEHILPSYSMPWLWGCVSAGLIAVATCFIVNIFQIKNKIIQGILAALVMVFPSEIGTMLYMFTSSSYAIAFLLAIVAVFLLEKESLWSTILAALFVIFACSIYQAYIAITASFLVLLLIQQILYGEKKPVFVLKKGCGYLIFLAISLGLYYGITLLLLEVTGNSLNTWAIRATSDTGGILYRAYRSWILFLAVFLKKTYGLVPNNFSLVAHVVCLICAGAASLWLVLRKRNWNKVLLFLALAGVLLPMSANCLVLLLGENGVHALTLYSFISVYVFIVIVLEALPEHRVKNLYKDVAAIGLVAVLICNIYSANKAYLKQYLVYENTVSFYESIITQVQMTPGFTEESKLAVIGNVPQDSSYLEKFGLNTIYGLCGFKGEAISDDFITYYLGFDIEYATAEEKQALLNDIRYQEMASYPYYGYVNNIDDYIVVKLGT